MGYVQKFDLCDVLNVKMWTILHEIELIWQDRIADIVVKSDYNVLGNCRLILNNSEIFILRNLSTNE